jgi:hypothetical protein
MGKVLTFRKPEENCANCWYYTSHANAYKGHDGSPNGLCRHPDRTKDNPPIHPLIERLGVHCDSDQWCPKYVHIDSLAMKKLQSVSDIKFALLCMQQRMKSYTTGIEESDEYKELVERFYQENKKLMTINQFKATRRSSVYFVELIDEVIKYYRQQSRERN